MVVRSFDLAALGSGWGERRAGYAKQASSVA
jgi:hypothetical protein